MIITKTFTLPKSLLQLTRDPGLNDQGYMVIWYKVFKNGPSKIYGRQPLKNLKGYPSGYLSSTNCTWSILEYFVPH